MATEKMAIKQVWMNNADEELLKMDFAMRRFPFVAVDTEFPGFLRNTPRDASFRQRYGDLKHNVDLLEPIQLGLACFDSAGQLGGVWEVNFRNFDPSTDLHVPASIDLLKNNGLDLDKNAKDGVDSYAFFQRFRDILCNNHAVRFITFHGLYDMAYLLKLATGGAPMPDSVLGFQTKLAYGFGRIYDIKFMARFFNGMMGGELGLERLAKILAVERSVGGCHQAGSDSLLTASVFMKMKQVYKFDERFYEGLIYGMDGRIPRPRPRLIRILPRAVCSQQFYYPPGQCAAYAPVQMPHSMIFAAPQRL